VVEVFPDGMTLKGPLSTVVLRGNELRSVVLLLNGGERTIDLGE
jgi:hypothetical protein